MEIGASNSNQFSCLQSEIDLSDLEEQLSKLIERLNFLENQINESRVQLQETILSKMETERNFEKEKREHSDTKSQLRAMQNTMQQWEQERVILKETSINQLFELESLKNGRNVINEQIKKLEIENIELKLRIEEIEKQLRDQKSLEKLINTKKSAVDSLFSSIHSQNRQLEKEINLFQKKFNVFRYIGEQAVLLLKHHHIELNNLNKENELLKQTQFVFGKNLMLSNISQACNDNKNQYKLPKSDDDNLKQYEETITDLKCKLLVEMDEKQQLNETLKTILEKQMKFDELEDNLRSKIL